MNESDDGRSPPAIPPHYRRFVARLNAALGSMWQDWGALRQGRPRVRMRVIERADRYAAWSQPLLGELSALFTDLTAVGNEAIAPLLVRGLVPRPEEVDHAADLFTTGVLRLYALRRELGEVLAPEPWTTDHQTLCEALDEELAEVRRFNDQVNAMLRDPATADADEDGNVPLTLTFGAGPAMQRLGAQGDAEDEDWPDEDDYLF